VSRRAVQDWESGLNHPDAEHLQALIAALLEADGLTLGSETPEAEALWAVAVRQAPRLRTPFDPVWFAGLVHRRSDPAASEELATAPSLRRHDWGEAPDALGFVGRATELAALRRWVLTERSRLTAVLGMGGIGKTSLTARLAQDVASGFQRLYWRSLRHALPVGEWLGGAIGFLSDNQIVPPEGEAARLTVLLQLLRERPTLLVLDSFETVLEPGQTIGPYRDGLAGYGQLLQTIGEGRHDSCLVVTSRESPPELAMLGGGSVRTLQLGGLGVAEARLLLADKHLSGSAQDWATLVGRVGGNGLALKIVGESIRELTGGDISTFLNVTGAEVYGGMRRLLAEQIERSSALERMVLQMLATEHKPVAITELMALMRSQIGRGAVLEAVEALRRRSLVEPAEDTCASAFTLQRVVLNYLTERYTNRQIVSRFSHAGGPDDSGARAARRDSRASVAAALAS
jgi:hypothetical protein